jgi:hypothetical protein
MVARNGLQHLVKINTGKLARTVGSEHLPELWQTIPQGTRVGSGRKSEGGFCSLDCYTSFYQLELAERARRLVERTKRKES